MQLRLSTFMTPSWLYLVYESRFRVLKISPEEPGPENIEAISGCIKKPLSNSFY